jgi:hypothetical protein
MSLDVELELKLKLLPLDAEDLKQAMAALYACSHSSAIWKALKWSTANIFPLH